MMNRLKQFVLVSNIVFIVQCETTYLSQCGIPPRPYLSSSPRDPDRLEGKSIYYYCINNPYKRNHLKCQNGRWTGKALKCGRTTKMAVSAVQITAGLNTKVFTVEKQVSQADISYIPVGVTLENPSAETYHWKLYLNGSTGITFIDLMIKSPGMDKQPIVVSDVSLSSKQCWPYQNRVILSSIHSFECNKSESNTSRRQLSTISFQTTSSSADNRTLSDITFDGLTLGLRPKKCGIPEILPYIRSSLVPSETALEKRIQLWCEDDDFMKPSGTLLCNKDGDWEGSYPNCKPKHICQKLNITAFEIIYTGTFYDSQTYLVEDTLAQVICNQRDIPISATCSQGLWSHNISCEAYVKKMPIKHITVITLSAMVVVVFITAIISARCAQRKMAALQTLRDDIDESNSPTYDTIVYGDLSSDPEYIDLYGYDVIAISHHDVTNIKRQAIYDDVS
ncbi:hypothetical protein HDE_01811 [Halotydeus destructor]|nr:hypothetical protein HDE_01811 [Halotydeus destructor]